MITLEDQLEFMKRQLERRRERYARGVPTLDALNKMARDIEIVEAIVFTVDKAKMLKEVGDEFLAEIEAKKNR